MMFFVVERWNGQLFVHKTDQPQRTKQQRQTRLGDEVERFILTAEQERYSLDVLKALWKQDKLKVYSISAPAKIPACFEALGLTPPTTRAAIEAAYRKAAKECHPDAGGSHNLMVRLNRARDRALKLVTA